MVGGWTKNWDFQAFVSGEVQPVLPVFERGVLGCVAGCRTTQPPGPVMVNRCGENWAFQAFVSGEVQPVLPGFVLGVAGFVDGCMTTTTGTCAGKFPFLSAYCPCPCGAVEEPVPEEAVGGGQGRVVCPLCVWGGGGASTPVGASRPCKHQLEHSGGISLRCSYTDSGGKYFG